MILLSPGLALFLFGVSSIPEVGTVASARFWCRPVSVWR